MVCDIVGSLCKFPRAKNRENRLSVQHLAAHHKSILMSPYHHNNDTIGFMFGVINMFWARLSLILARAANEGS